MSGCFRTKKVSDKDALDWLLTHSTVSVLSNESSNALVLLLSIKDITDINNPYLRIYFSMSQKKMIQEPIVNMVLKLTPLGTDDNNNDNNKKEKILVENQVISVADHQKWQDEVHLQKYVFYHTYMIDMQMQAVCPNVLCSFSILPSQIHYFLSLIHIADKKIPIKRKFKHWEYGEIRERLSIDEKWKEKKTTHCKTIIDFFRQIYNHHLTVGCMVMEYLENATDMVEYPCVQGSINREKNLGTDQQYSFYLYGKAYGLIQYDKCRSIGVEHDDLHWGNMVTYLTPDGEMATAIIDFGIAHKTIPYPCKRSRLFKTTIREMFEHDESKPYTEYVRNTYSYLDCLLRSNPKLKEWNDITRKIKPHSKHYCCVPIDYMNVIDHEMVEKGNILSRHLLDLLTTRKKIVTNHDLLSLYLIFQQVDENCISLLDPSTPECVTFSSYTQNTQNTKKTKDDLISKKSKKKTKKKHKSAYRF